MTNVVVVAAVFLPALRRLHQVIRDQVIEACEAADRSATGIESLSASHDAGEAAGDTTYAIDRVSEDVLLRELSALAAHVPFVLVAEGLPEGHVVLPRGTPRTQARYRVIVDPIDGTRGLMYGKRSAWILTGVAPETGDPRLSDVVLALQTEIPTPKQHLCDALWAIAGEGVQGERWDRVRGTASPFAPRPSSATSLADGFASLARFFPGERTLLSTIDDAFIEAAVGPGVPGRAACFEDQYISTGGQIYELLCGHDRFIADLRGLVSARRVAAGRPALLCCHPYDLCTELIAREAGVVMTDPAGQRLSAPLDTTTPISWVGFANAALAETLMPHLQAALRAHDVTVAPAVGSHVS